MGWGRSSKRRWQRSSAGFGCWLWRSEYKTFSLLRAVDNVDVSNEIYYGFGVIGDENLEADSIFLKDTGNAH